MGSLYTGNASEALQAAERARRGGRAILAEALRDARARTLALFAAFEAALGAGLRVPHSHELNLPLWELGHIGWFADWWIARNPERALGTAADPDVGRLAPRLRGADGWYNSSEVAHATRWALDLPDAQAVRAELQASLDETLRWLDRAQEDDQGLYFFRLALFHEDMHTEAATYMAQTLGLDPFSRGASPHPSPKLGAPQTLILPATEWTLGRNGPGFDFDNERGASQQTIAELAIDSQPVSWARYLPFVESGAADMRAHWSDAGWAWRQAQPSAAPRYLRQTADGWQGQKFGVWQALDLSASACHLTAFEAQAWCHWAQRRLPTEAEWEAAALTLPDFQWGTVWEWTASAFAPFPGFEPHPYRDYSQPWFDGRPVLKGASPATAPRMRHPRYRNFFTAERNDIVAGFRSVG
jgi:gamma-glutamyl hercynylcysteine S-oxide synthase